MNEHISYAMRNKDAVQSFINFNAPGSLLDWSHLIIELIFLAGMILTVLHAVRHSRKNGNNSAIYTVVGAFLYGLVMDIISYYTVESFWHGEFTVMLVFNRLPLYIVFLYPALIYHAFMTIRRYEFTPLIQASGVGFFAGLMYMIFDNMGPQAGWWIWDRVAPSNQPFLSSVPLTSYGWCFLYTAAFALLAEKFCWKWPSEGRHKTAIYAGVATLPITTILLGTLLFVPYSALAKNVPPWNLMNYQPAIKIAAAVHAISFTAAGLAFILNYKKPRFNRDRLLMIFPLIYLAGMSYIFIAKYHLFLNVSPEGLTTNGLAIGNLPVVILSTVASTAIVLSSHPAKE